MRQGGLPLTKLGVDPHVSTARLVLPVPWILWILCPSSIVEQVSSGRRAKTAPLLKEEGDTGLQTLITDRTCPLGFHGAKIWTTFPADDDPVNTSQVQHTQRA
jgi:hypothetical protein